MLMGCSRRLSLLQHHRFSHNNWTKDPDGVSTRASEAVGGDVGVSVQREFLDSLALSQLPKIHLFALYSELVDRVIALEAARLTGAYTLKNAGSSWASTVPSKVSLSICGPL